MLSSEFMAFLHEQGTEWHLTTQDTPQHNGMAKALNHCLVECVCLLLIHAALLKTLWAKALLFTVWVKNQTIMCALGNATTPHE